MWDVKINLYPKREKLFQRNNLTSHIVQIKHFNTDSENVRAEKLYIPHSSDKTGWRTLYLNALNPTLHPT